MKTTVEKLDDVNTLVKGTIDAEAIEKALDKLAKEAQKHVKVDGFRPGKVPLAMVKKIHGERLRQDAESEALGALVDEAVKEAGIDAAKLIGQPLFKRYEKNESGAIEVELELASRPEPAIEGYEKLVPKYKKPTASQKEIDAKLKEYAEQNVEYEPLKRKRALKEGDWATIDFEGFIDGEAFEGGKAEKFNLVIGSGQFIPGFEEQLVGMKIGESKEIEVTFPEEYPAENLAGKAAKFNVVLHEIKQKGEAKADDALAQKLLGKEEATLEDLKAKIAEQIEREKLSKLYHDELKPKLIDALVEAYDFALPHNIVEQEIDAQVSAKVRQMSAEELTALREDEEKIKAMREELREEAERSVKATFIVDLLAQKEDVSVSDQEVSEALYYEAIMSGQEPAQVIKYYQEQNLLPAVKMGMIEDKLFGKLLKLDEA